MTSVALQNARLIFIPNSTNPQTWAVNRHFKLCRSDLHEIWRSYIGRQALFVGGPVLLYVGLHKNRSEGPLQDSPVSQERLEIFRRRECHHSTSQLTRITNSGEIQSAATYVPLIASIV